MCAPPVQKDYLKLVSDNNLECLGAPLADLLLEDHLCTVRCKTTGIKPFRPGQSRTAVGQVSCDSRPARFSCHS